MVALLVEPCLCAAFYEDFQFDFRWLRWRDDFAINSDMVDFVAPRAGDIALPQRLRLLRQLPHPDSRGSTALLRQPFTIDGEDSRSFTGDEKPNQARSKLVFESHFFASLLSILSYSRSCCSRSRMDSLANSALLR